jgi:hypothetical protein
VHSKPPQVKEPPVPRIRSTPDSKNRRVREFEPNFSDERELASGHLTEIRIQRAAGSGYFKKAPKSRQFWHFKKFKYLTGFMKEWAQTRQFLGGYLIFFENHRYT